MEREKQLKEQQRELDEQRTKLTEQGAQLAEQDAKMRAMARMMLDNGMTEDIVANAMGVSIEKLRSMQK